MRMTATSENKAHGLSKAHLISQDPIEAIVPQRDHPFDALQLIRPKVSFDERHQILLHLFIANTAASDNSILMSFSILLSQSATSQSLAASFCLKGKL